MSMLDILACFFFKRTVTFTCNSIETKSAMKMRDREVGAEDAVLIEFK